ncbi:MAG: hypothetical protein V3U72_03365 [Candidatus Aenigmarchaeota archaeon]
MAPRELGARFLGQTPTTDPKSLIGRNMDVGVPEITGDNSKYYMKVKVRISKIEGNTCLTSFNGFECAREHLMRMVRKRNQKVENVFDVVTKDGWLLRIKPWAVLNGKPATSVGSKMRHFTMNFFNEFARKNNMNDLVRKIISTEIQMRIKREGSKIYPVRFSEIARIKVLRSPEFRMARPKPEEKKEAKPEEKPKEEKKQETPKPEEKEVAKPKEEKPEEKKEAKTEEKTKKEKQKKKETKPKKK